jgi:signal transduction histidine kinase
MPLRGALLLLLALALGSALIPAGVALDRRISAELRGVAVEDLGRAPMILEDRLAAREEALVMHAVSVAETEGLAEALAGGRLQQAVQAAAATAEMYGEEPVLASRDGTSVVGPSLPAEVVEAVRREGATVAYLFEGGTPLAVGVAPLPGEAVEMGVAGSAAPLHEGMAMTLAALAQADVTVVGPDGTLVASTLSADSAEALAAAAGGGAGRQQAEKVREVPVGEASVWVARGELAGAGSVLFSRAVEAELAALPALRRGALAAGLLTLVLALGVGLLVSIVLTRPVTGLAAAADRVAHGDFGAPIPSSSIGELDRLATAFRSMRESLEDRLAELAEANRALEDRQRRLQELQAELIRRDRVASSGRMAAELAHEIRNPVANVRNCLEVVRRTLPDGSEGGRFADMAIDELLRMHELAEQLLDLHRPVEADGSADVGAVARQVAVLSGVGGSRVPVVVRAPEEGPTAAVPPDSLKQILFNLVENAREAAGPGAEVELVVQRAAESVAVEVLDRGPGFPPDVLPHVFDPFFTTKEAVTGVGLGLSVAEGLVRRHGGRMEAGNREGGGARVRVEVPAVEGTEGRDRTRALRSKPSAGRRADASTGGSGPPGHPTPPPAGPAGGDRA